MHLAHLLLELEVRVEQVQRLLLMLAKQFMLGVAAVDLLQVQVQKELADLVVVVLALVVEQVMMQ